MMKWATKLALSLTEKKKIFITLSLCNLSSPLTYLYVIYIITLFIITIYNYFICVPSPTIYYKTMCFENWKSSVLTILKTIFSVWCVQTILSWSFLVEGHKHQTYLYSKTLLNYFQQLYLIPLEIPLFKSACGIITFSRFFLLI